MLPLHNFSSEQELMLFSGTRYVKTKVPCANCSVVIIRVVIIVSQASCIFSHVQKKTGGMLSSTHILHKYAHLRKIRLARKTKW